MWFGCSGTANAFSNVSTEKLPADQTVEFDILLRFVCYRSSTCEDVRVLPTLIYVAFLTHLKTLICFCSLHLFLIGAPYTTGLVFQLEQGRIIFWGMPAGTTGLKTTGRWADAFTRMIFSSSHGGNLLYYRTSHSAESDYVLLIFARMVCQWWMSDLT